MFKYAARAASAARFSLAFLLLFSLPAAAQTVPAPWTSQDVGSPALAGSADYASETFTVHAGGTDIGGSSDQFHFVHQLLTGDGEIVARVDSLVATHVWAKAGVMMRESLAANAAHAFAQFAAGHGTAFQRRLSAGASSTTSSGTKTGAPYWVRLQRQGDLFRAYESANGTTWRLIGEEAIAMPDTIYVGLAVTSRHASKRATAAISGVGVTEAAPAPAPPTVTLTSPDNGATYTAPATVELSATAGATDATIARVDFFAGSTLVGTETTSPYAASWTDIAAGSYSITARATDSNGATATSAPVSVTVNSPSNQPPTVTITSPANGATFTAPATITVSANASDSDGTVGRVDFYAGTTLIGSDTSSPYSFSWSNVAAGGYSLTARATDNAGATTTCSAVSVQVTDAGGTVPAPWTAQDVGSPALSGSAAENAGAFTIEAAGVDIWDTADEFHFVHQLLTGDAEIVARVQSLGATDVWAKAGVMMRESLASGSTHAYAAITPGNGLAFQRRTSTNGSSLHTAGTASAAPYWVRLRRAGDTFTAHASNDGATWRLIGSDTIAMNSTLYVGLAVTSHNVNAPTTAQLNNVAARELESTPNQSPSVALTSPANGATFTAPATITVSASASDSDGTISRLDFFAGTTLIGSDTSSPYSITWSSVPAGSYSLTARATDDDGATTTSSLVSITVNSTTNQPPTVSLTSPTSGTSFIAPAAINITASASDSDGTIARVDFYVGSTLLGSDTTSPYSIGWNVLAAGTYTLAARATDNQGATTTSAQVTVTANPTRALFTASPDHDTLVTSYRLEIFVAGVDPSTATPVATRDLGKPTPSNGEIDVDITPTLAPMAPGSYFATVSAIGSGGSARSAPSGTFTR